MKTRTYALDDIYCAWLSATTAALSKMSPEEKEKLQPVFGQTLEYALDALECPDEQIAAFIHAQKGLPDKVAHMLVKIKESELRQVS